MWGAVLTPEPALLLLPGNVALAKEFLQKKWKVEQVVQRFPGVVVRAIKASPMDQEEGACLRRSRIPDRVHSVPSKPT